MENSNVGILELIAKGEGQDIEFKSSLSERKEILETICAFSNSNGGTILVGVDDNGNLVGIEMGKGVIEGLINEIKSSIEPPVIPQIETAEAHGKKVLVIRVSEGLNKPYLLKGIAFKRFGRTNQRIPREELEKIILEKHRTILSFEERVFDANLKDIDELKVKNFVAEVKSARNIDLPYATVRDFLERLGLFKEKLTAAALLCFSKNPQAYIPYAIVKCGRFRNGIADEREIHGTVLDQISGVLEFLKNHIRVQHSVDGRGRRVDRWEIPLEAIREAVVNAVAHRDYGVPSPVYVKVFDDRVEVINPGGLMPPLTPEKLKKEHPSVLRNPKIANVLFLYGYVERWGYGTNKIVELCVENGLREPDFVEEDGFFKVVLYRSSVNEMERVVLDLVKKGFNTSSAVAKKLNINERTARKYLSSLVSKNLINRKRIGRRIIYY
jgi:ATP-dependent DNA helicase RecG